MYGCGVWQGALGQGGGRREAEEVAAGEGAAPAQPTARALVDASATTFVMASASTSTSVWHSMFSHVPVALTKLDANASAVACTRSTGPGKRDGRVE